MRLRKKKRNAQWRRLTAWIAVLCCLLLCSCGTGSAGTGAQQADGYPADPGQNQSAAGQSSAGPGQLSGTEAGDPGAGSSADAGAADPTAGSSAGAGAADPTAGSSAGAGAAADGTMSVTFLDVGQGNAVLVECDGLYLLADGGDREYSSFVVAYLKRQGVTELEYVIASHYDADHLNGVVGVLNAFPCEQVLAPDYTTDTRVYESFCNVITERDIPLAYPAMGETYRLGAAEFTIVCPDGYDDPDDNDNSIGIRLVYGDTSFLICGDAGADVEKMMLQSGLTIESDVYMASHHGSSGSSSAEFVRAVAPEAVVISAGAGNSYGHPTTRVLEEVQSVGAALYRTDLQGTLIAVSDGTQITWNVGPSEDYRDGDAVAASEAGKADGAAGAGSGETNAQTAEGAETPEAAGSGQQTYILNRNTKKFHLPSCSSADDIHAENRAEFTGDRQELLDAGYDPCKRCHP